MTTDQLRNAIRAQPFDPFVIHLADQRQFEVTHPEMIGDDGGRIAVVFEGGGDAVQLIDLLLVTGLEIKNGGTPRKRRNQ